MLSGSGAAEISEIHTFGQCLFSEVDLSIRYTAGAKAVSFQSISKYFFVSSKSSVIAYYGGEQDSFHV